MKDKTEYFPSRLEETYSILMTTKAMTSVGDCSQILVSDVYNFVKGYVSDQKKYQNISFAISNSSILMSHYRYLLSRERTIFAPISVAAASTDEVLMERRTNDFLIKVISSRHKNNQFHIILRLDNPKFKAHKGRIAVHITKGSDFSCLVFPEPHDDKTHLLVEHNDPAVQLISNHEYELSLVFE